MRNGFASLTLQVQSRVAIRMEATSPPPGGADSEHHTSYRLLRRGSPIGGTPLHGKRFCIGQRSVRDGVDFVLAAERDGLLRELTAWKQNREPPRRSHSEHPRRPQNGQPTQWTVLRRPPAQPPALHWMDFSPPCTR